MPKKPSQPQDKYVLRLPDGLRDKIKKAADANNRSMNAEIVFRIGDYDRALTDLSSTDEQLVKREEALFAERVRLRHLVGGGLDELDELLRTKQQEIDELRASLNAEKEKFRDLEMRFARLQGMPANNRAGVTLTEAEKEDLWQWLQGKVKAERKARK